MRGAVRTELDTTRAPALDVSPREVRKPPTAVCNIPPIQATGVVGDDEARGRESDVPKRRKRVVAKAAIGVIERDDQLAWRESSDATNRIREFGERERPPPRLRQRLHLDGEATRRESRHTQLSPPLDLVVTQNRRDHGARVEQTQHRLDSLFPTP
jgi:hypothetical protein